MENGSRVICAFASCTFDYKTKEEVVSVAFMAECEFLNPVCCHEDFYLYCQNSCYEQALNIENQMIQDEDWPEMIGVVDDSVLQELGRTSEMRHSVQYNFLPDQTN